MEILITLSMIVSYIVIGIITSLYFAYRLGSSGSGKLTKQQIEDGATIATMVFGICWPLGLTFLLYFAILSKYCALIESANKRRFS